MKVTEKDREAIAKELREQGIANGWSQNVPWDELPGARKESWLRLADIALRDCAAAYARGLEDAAKVLPTLPRYEVGGECDGDSGHCYAEMELDDSGRYVGIDDAQAAIRKLGEDK